MEIDAIQNKVHNGNWVVSSHADQEAADEDIDVAHIRDAILADEILEQYADTGRGPACLVLGFVERKPIHVVCGWRGESVVIVTVYIPKPPRFVDPWTRGRAQ